MLNITIVYNTLSNKISSDTIMVMLTILLILGYHVFMVTRYNRKFRKVITKLENMKLYRWIKIRIMTKEENLREMRHDSYYESCTQCREPLIEYDST